MSYPDITSEGFLDDLLKRKEFYSLRSLSDDNFRESDDDFLAGKYLKPHSYQLFSRNWMNPNTQYKRLHLGHTPGSGKTISAHIIALEFIAIYKNMYYTAMTKLSAGRRSHNELDKVTPSIFVLGFGGTKSAFVKELLTHPEFGFISHAEKEELSKRQRSAEVGLIDDVKHYKEYYNQLKKRITNKSRDGFFKFFGYDEFVNRLFVSETVKLKDLENITMARIRGGQPHTTLEEVFNEYISNDTIQINTQLLSMFENSLIICDEIHNTYNMNMKNNRGVAIQYLLDTVPSIRFLSLSATPMNNSPTEVIELLNYLLPPDQKITKRDFFINSNTLAEGKLEEIGRLSRGKISFLQDSSLKYFPKKEFLGEDIILPKSVGGIPQGGKIPYLKFIPCVMSPLHQRTYNAMNEERSGIPTSILADAVDSSIENTSADSNVDNVNKTPVQEIDPEDADDVQKSYHTIPTDGYSIYDMVFPNPDSDETGLFRSSDVYNKLSMAPQSWKNQKKITIKRYLNKNIMTGDFLKAENIGTYATKYETLINMVLDIIKRSNGDPNKSKKIMIYHDRKQMSGVLLIQELLIANNIIDEYSEPVDNTICCICCKPLSAHSARMVTGPTPPAIKSKLKKAELKAQADFQLQEVVLTAQNESVDTPQIHDFMPVRFIMAHSDIEKPIMNQSLAKFNTVDNTHGHKYMILVGSRIIKESYDFKSNQELIITTLPTNIPTMLQVIGRCVRKDSHIQLPPDQRKVSIRILISTVNTAVSYNDLISPEMYRYIDKLNDYILIQQIEREFNKNAIDANIHRSIIMSDELLSTYFPNGATKPVDMIGNLYFKPVDKLPHYTLGDLTLSTFTAYKYYIEEIKTITYIIKRLFLLHPIWTYDRLWASVTNPPVGVEVNPKLFNEHNFIISLNNLVSSAPTIISARDSRTEYSLIERIFDYNDRFIYQHGTKYRVTHMDKYYILFPVTDTVINPLNVVYAEYTEHIRDRERAMIKEWSNQGTRVIADVETYLRAPEKQTGALININNYMRDAKDNVNYIAVRKAFIEKYGAMLESEMKSISDNKSTGDKSSSKLDQPDISDFLVEFSAKFQMSFVAEAIVYSVIGHKTQKAEPGVVNLYNKIIDLLNKFRVIVYAKEVIKYKDTAKQYSASLTDMDPDTPIGYMSTKSVRLFDPMTGGNTSKWIDINKIALNRHITYKENEIIIGYFETAEDHMKFKLRKPVQNIKTVIKEGRDAKTMSSLDSHATRITVGDTRLIERGIVCGTKNKHELMRIIAKFGISLSNLDKSDIRIKRLCTIIKQTLIRNEMHERRKDSRYKYLYSWWDEVFDLATRV